MNDYLSELVEKTVEELQNAKCISVKEDEMELEPANLGRIAAFYYIKYQTIERMATRLEDEGRLQSRKMRELLETLAQAGEFEGLPIR